MGRIKFSLGRLMVATGLIAFCFAVLGIMAGAILSVSILVVAIVPFSTRWEALEVAATIAWLLLATVASNEVSPSAVEFLLLGPSYLILGVSWGLRLFARRMRGQSRLNWPSLLFIPASLLLGVVLVITEPAFQLRFALSEAALTSFAQQVPVGSHQSLWLTPRRFGLIQVLDVEERAGGTYFTTSAFIRSSEGLVYFPRSAPPASSDYVFRHLRGRWWRFWESH